MNGQPLDFAMGRTLTGNEGIVAAGKDVHPQAVEAVAKALAEAR